MAAWLERDAEISKIAAECKALEERAGIGAAMERAREGQLMPDPNDSTEEYFAEEHDAVRSKTRDAYFSVADVGMRRALIAANLRVRRMQRQGLEAEVEDAIKALGAAEAHANRPRSLLKATFTLVGMIATGMALGVIGVIVGGLIGYYVAGLREEQSALDQKPAIDSLKENVKVARESVNEFCRNPEFFSAREETTGARDEAFDRESAYANLFDKKQPLRRIGR